MHTQRRAIVAAAIAGLLAVALLAAAPVPPAWAAAEPPGAAPAQYYGHGWGGAPWWSGGVVYVSPSLTAPYAGSPGYPYYRYGPYYGSAFGLPYQVYPSFGAYYNDGASPIWPGYSSAGGISFGGDYGIGYVAPFGRCLYSAMAGIGGSWTDPQSYGYYAPFC
jgi:hypothetical protein